MTDKKNDTPGDEFDRIEIPAFLTRPFERLGGRSAPGVPSARPAARADAQPGDPLSADGTDGAPADDEQPAPRTWWAGYRGKLLLYGVGTLVMVFLQSRG